MQDDVSGNSRLMITISFDMREKEYYHNYVFMLCWLTERKIEYRNKGYRLHIDFEDGQDAIAFKLLFM